MGRDEYPNPGLVEISLVVAGDDLLHEVAGGTEPAPLPQQERGLGGVDGGPGVQDRLQIAVDPVVPCHDRTDEKKRDNDEREEEKLSLSLSLSLSLAGRGNQYMRGDARKKRETRGREASPRTTRRDRTAGMASESAGARRRQYSIGDKIPVFGIRWRCLAPRFVTFKNPTVMRLSAYVKRQVARTL
ncbi:hypothetical protein GW17_00011698 [Ensete ventricosum]|nr:hypothetical protein GW17_00011698 [Ensete ventricosum]